MPEGVGRREGENAIPGPPQKPLARHEADEADEAEPYSTGFPSRETVRPFSFSNRTLFLDTSIQYSVI